MWLQEVGSRWSHVHLPRRKGLAKRDNSALLLVCLTALLGWLTTGCTSEPQAEALPQADRSDRPPHIIVVSFDALRADRIGAYGGRSEATPHIDAFAEGGLLYENAYSMAPVTPTSFSSLFSGLHPWKVFRGWQFSAPTTLAEHLGNSGYHTAAIVNNVQLAPERGFDRGFVEYLWSHNRPDREVLKDAEAWIEAVPLRNDQPLFLWVHFLRPHAPYVERPDAAHLYRPGYDGPFKRTTGGTFDTEDPEDLERIKDLYLGEVWTADLIFGRLLEVLETRGLVENSVIALTSDHGEEFKEHGRFQHTQLYEPNIRVPLIVQFPGVEPGRVATLARGIDLVPTLLDLAGLHVPEGLDGRVLNRTGTSPETALFAVSMTEPNDHSLSLTEDGWKLILQCHPSPSAELYHLAADPAEAENLATVETRRARVMLQKLNRIVGEAPCTAMVNAMQGVAQGEGLDDESRAALRALGYLQ